MFKKRISEGWRLENPRKKTVRRRSVNNKKLYEEIEESGELYSKKVVLWRKHNNTKSED